MQAFPCFAEEGQLFRNKGGCVLCSSFVGVRGLRELMNSHFALMLGKAAPGIQTTKELRRLNG